MQEQSEVAQREAQDSDLRCIHILEKLLELQATCLRRYEGALFNRAHRSTVVTAFFRCCCSLIVPLCEQIARAAERSFDLDASCAKHLADANGIVVADVVADPGLLKTVSTRYGNKEQLEDDLKIPDDQNCFDGLQFSPDMQHLYEVLLQVSSSWADVTSAVNLLPANWRLQSSTSQIVVRACNLHVALLGEMQKYLHFSRSPQNGRSHSKLGDNEKVPQIAKKLGSWQHTDQLLQLLAELRKGCLLP